MSIKLIVQVSLVMMGALQSDSYYNRVLDKADNVLYMYPKHAESIAEVDWCEKEQPCAIVSKRFWLPHIVTRQCRCKNLPCNTQYSSDNMKPDTIQLDNRSQFKMCENGESDVNMKRCQYGGSEIGISIEEVRTPNEETSDNRSKTTGNHQTLLTESKVKVHCRCVHGYWQLSRHTLDKINSTTEIHRNHYHCNRLSRCKKGDFCGHIRGDTHSTYYRCSCPQGTLCISNDRTLRNASELLFDGLMYRAFCQTIPTTALDQTSQEN